MHSEKNSFEINNIQASPYLKPLVEISLVANSIVDLGCEVGTINVK